MKPSFFRAIAATLVAASLVSACKPTPSPADAAAATPIQPALIPVPKTLESGEGRFVVDANTQIHFNSPSIRHVAQQFNRLLAAADRPELEIDKEMSAKEDGILFFVGPDLSHGSPEGYTLDVRPNGITVSASTDAGLFYGAMTLWQLLTQGEGETVALPAMHIEDAPRFGWRGYMLDSARHFWSVDEIKRVLDAMAVHKLNMFHWHLTDDQGWRIQIDKYPKLTEVGSCRIPAGDAGIDPKSAQPAPYCGFYTKAQIRDVVAYAAARHIEVVPEFDVPGHATAAIAAYPELGVLGQAPAVSNEWGVHLNLFNTEESTFKFLEDVLAEIVELFPGRYVHIGGDEAAKDQWKASARVQQRMKELGAKDEMAMQGIFVARLEKFLAAHGKRLIGWDEILESELPPSAAVMSWRGIEGGVEAANKGHDVVMTPVSDLYFDYLQSASPKEPPGRPTLIPLEKAYAFEPVPDALPADRQKHILGLQANLWTEHMRTFDRVLHNSFPRLAAVAETAWSPKAKKDFADFSARLPAMLKRYDALGLNYARTPFEKIPAPDAHSRRNDQLAMCGEGLGLRLEDDGPFAGERAIYNVDIYQPCWLWKQADLSKATTIEVRAGRLPYNFQLADWEKARKFKPAKSAHGELVIRAGCEGKELASVALPAKPETDGFAALKATLPMQSASTDLCVYFTGDTRPTMWVLDRMTLQP